MITKEEAIYIKKKLNGRIFKSKSMVIGGVHECVTVGLIINRNKTALVSCVYRCSGSHLLWFCDTMERLFYRFSKIYNILICRFQYRFM